MNLFSDIPVLHPEVLATAVLRHLLLRSRVCREAVLAVIDRESPFPLISRTRFSCYKEYSALTNTDKAQPSTHGLEVTAEPLVSESGRIDLVIEMDNAVLGIEAKIGADLQDDQPQKYEAKLQEMAGLLTTLHGPQVSPLIVLLAPRDRKQHIVGQIKSRGGVSLPWTFVTWEDILEELGTRAAEMDDESAFVVRELKDYLYNEFLSFFPGFERSWHHLLDPWQVQGSVVQNDFLKTLVRLLPDAIKVSPAKAFTGVNFDRDDETQKWRSWIGFTADPESGTPATRSILVLQSMVKPQSVDSGQFEEIARLKLQGFDWGLAWKVKLNGAWSRPEVWTERLRPFFSGP